MNGYVVISCTDSIISSSLLILHYADSSTVEKSSMWPWEQAHLLPSVWTQHSLQTCQGSCSRPQRIDARKKRYSIICSYAMRVFLLCLVSTTQHKGNWNCAVLIKKAVVSLYWLHSLTISLPCFSRAHWEAGLLQELQRWINHCTIDLYKN